MTDLHHHGTEHESTTGVHGMLLVGAEPTYLSHLPMFMAPHNHQVLLKVALDDTAARHVRDVNAAVGTDRLLTVEPEEFPITDLKGPGLLEPTRTTFRGDVVLGHFERGGETLTEGALVSVVEVIHFDTLPLRSEATPQRGDLEYLLFGDADRELYLAHRITAAPDFDQVLVVEISGAHFTEIELSRQGRPTLVVVGRADLSGQRLRSGETVSAHTSAGQHHHRDVEVHVLREYYFEADELR